MELRQLEYFVAVVEERNFTRAAKWLHVVQSAVSAGVSGLRTRTRTPLTTLGVGEGQADAITPPAA